MFADFNFSVDIKVLANMAAGLSFSVEKKNEDSFQR